MQKHVPPKTKGPRISPGPARFNQALSWLGRGRSRRLVLLFVFPLHFRALYRRIRRRSRRRHALRRRRGVLLRLDWRLGRRSRRRRHAFRRHRSIFLRLDACIRRWFFFRAALTELGAVAFVVSVGADVTGPLSLFFFSGGGVAPSVIRDEGVVLG